MIFQSQKFQSHKMIMKVPPTTYLCWQLKLQWLTNFEYVVQILLNKCIFGSTPNHTQVTYRCPNKIRNRIRHVFLSEEVSVSKSQSIDSKIPQLWTDSLEHYGNPFVCSRGRVLWCRTPLQPLPIQEDALAVKKIICSSYLYSFESHKISIPKP